MDTIVILVALVIFLGIVAYSGGFKAILNALDARGNGVKAELAEAARLRGEAEALLKDLQERRIVAEREAEQLLADARAEAERIRIEQEQKLAEFVTRRTKLAEQKIAMAEAQATADVRAAAADAAVKAAEILLRGSPASDTFVTKGIAQLRDRIN